MTINDKKTCKTKLVKHVKQILKELVEVSDGATEIDEWPKLWWERSITNTQRLTNVNAKMPRILFTDFENYN